MNKIILLGRLTKDIELKETVSGKSYARAGLAVDRPFSKNKEVDFFNLVAWDRTNVSTCDVVVGSVFFADDKKPTTNRPVLAE